MGHFLVPLLKNHSAPWALRVEGRATHLATHVASAFDSGTRNRGLLGRDSLAPGTALVLAPCTAVHTWFMRFPLDIIFCGRDGRVLKVVESVGPWRMTAVWRQGFAVIELAAGTTELPSAGQMLVLEPFTP